MHSGEKRLSVMSVASKALQRYVVEERNASVIEALAEAHEARPQRVDIDESVEELLLPNDEGRGGDMQVELAQERARPHDDA